MVKFVLVFACMGISAHVREKVQTNRTRLFFSLAAPSRRSASSVDTERQSELCLAKCVLFCFLVAQPVLMCTKFHVITRYLAEMSKFLEEANERIQADELKRKQNLLKFREADRALLHQLRQTRNRVSFCSSQASALLF